MLASWADSCFNMGMDTNEYTHRFDNHNLSGSTRKVSRLFIPENGATMEVCDERTNTGHHFYSYRSKMEYGPFSKWFDVTTDEWNEFSMTLINGLLDGTYILLKRDSQGNWGTAYDANTGGRRANS